MRGRLWRLNSKSHKLVIELEKIKSVLSPTYILPMEIKVALFEDNKKLRESLVQLINSTEGMTCTGAFADANELIRNMQQANPDVVMMDINMPGLSGIEAVQVIKEKFPDVQILMQTVFDDNDKIFAAICAGASGYILKKTPPQKIIVALEETYSGGAPMTPSVAVKVLQLLKLQNKAEKSEFIDLSEREKEILSLLVKGKSYKLIASECFISIDTVSTHVRHIYEKLHVHSKSEAVAKAIFQKLI
jgi:DNA-binding NarL/FixJ family response regulator